MLNSGKNPFQFKPFLLNNRLVNPEQILYGKTIDINNEFEEETIRFTREWFSDNELFHFSSSGTTGPAKSWPVTRKQILASCEKTIRHLNLETGITALLCMNPKFTGGKMMLARCFAVGFNLVAVNPERNPLKNLPEDTKIDFISLIPYQLKQVIDDGYYRKILHENSTILVGGAPITDELGRMAADLPGKIYHTFGMTETLSHIALRKINHPGIQDYYETLEDITISVNDRTCLEIYYPAISDKKIVTRDLVEIIDERRFIWNGRLDNIINSGGVKIQVDLLEKEIEKILENEHIHIRNVIVGIPDENLGEKLVLCLESGPELKEWMDNLLKNKLSKYHHPRAIYPMGQFPETVNGKIDREKIRLFLFGQGPEK